MLPEFSDYRDKNPDASNVPEDTDVDENSSEEMKILMRTLGIKKEKCPESVKDLYHKLMKMAYLPRTIETIFECNNDDLIYLFYTICVSQSVGKRKWNQYSKTKYLSSYVSSADEAFAMVIVENNVAKWMNEIRFGKQNNRTFRFKTLYTEGDQGRKWTVAGTQRFLNLLKFCKAYRVNDEKKEIYQSIERMILSRERSTSDTTNINPDEEDVSDSDDECEDIMEMEAELLAMANGEN